MAPAHVALSGLQGIKQTGPSGLARPQCHYSTVTATRLSPNSRPLQGCDEDKNTHASPVPLNVTRARPREGAEDNQLFTLRAAWAPPPSWQPGAGGDKPPGGTRANSGSHLWPHGGQGQAEDEDTKCQHWAHRGCQEALPASPVLCGFQQPLHLSGPLGKMPYKLQVGSREQVLSPLCVLLSFTGEGAGGFCFAERETEAREGGACPWSHGWLVGKRTGA